MISLKKNKYKTFIFLLLFSQFAIASSATKSNNFLIKNKPTQQVNLLDLRVNNPDPDIFYLKVTDFN